MEYQDLSQEYKIFSDCFPDIFISENIFKKKLSGCKIFREYENGVQTSFAAVEKNSIAVICVLPKYRNNGYGKGLLKKCEDFILSAGYDTAVLGRNSGDLFWGAVINNMSHRFFESSGYFAYNGCLDMTLCLEDFSYEEMKKKYPCPSDISFEVYEGKNLDEFVNAVNKVEPKWASQYVPDKHDKFIAAKVGGRISGFMTADTDAETIITDGENKVGLLGYLGVIPSQRKKGIGRNILIFTLQFLKENGCTDVFINYTSLDEWYTDIGFEEYLWFWMGEKKLK